jgi:CDP-glucose 4,6-dehydratase
MLTGEFALYSGKTVLVTGHTGFKGSWLCLWLQLLGAKVIGYALDPKDENDIFCRAEVGEGLSDQRGDIRDHDKLVSIFSRHSPEFVFHLAAQPIVREGFRDPKETLDVNVGGTVNVLEACRATPSVKSIIVVTSDKCYENKGKAAPFKECDRLGGFDPYSASKACAEIVSLAYHHSFFQTNTRGNGGIGLVTARAGNVIGGGDWAKERLVPDCMRALHAGRPVMIRNPLYTRPWQFVLEPLAGYLRLGASLHENPGKFSGAWNFGPVAESTVPVKDLVRMIIKAYGRGSFVVEELSDQPKESRSLSLDASKAARKLKWHPRLTLSQAVRMTVDWYEASEKKRAMREFSLRQIREYSARRDK